MAFNQGLKNLNLPASGDLSADQYMFVDLISGAVAIPAAAGAKAIGVLQDKPTVVGEPAEVAILGITKLVAGAAFNKGAQLMSDSLGRGVTATTGHQVLAYALQAATAAGQIVPALLVPMYGI